MLSILHRKDRVYLPDKRTRDLLRLYSQGKARLKKQDESILPETALKNLIMLSKDTDGICEPRCRSFIFDICTSFSASAILPRQSETGDQVLKQIIQGNPLSHLECQKLLEEFPSLFEICQYLQATFNQIPDCLRVVLDELRNKREFIRNWDIREEENYPPPEECEEEHFPLWPRLKGIPQYSLDTQVLECDPKIQSKLPLFCFL